MSYTDLDRTLALAGVFQAARLTRQLGRRGMTDASALSSSQASIFRLNPVDVADVYGGVQGVSMGLRALIDQLDTTQDRDAEISRYAVGVIQLAIKLTKDAAGQEGLGRDISDLEDRRKAFDMDDAAMFAPLADIYQRHISTLTPRIMVKGEPLHLQNPDTAARIRACLLAGIRAAHLWLQCGGSRWQLIFKRRHYVLTARELLNTIDNH